MKRRNKHLYRHWLGLIILAFALPFVLSITFYGLVVDRQLRENSEDALSLFADQSEALLEGRLGAVSDLAYRLAGSESLVRFAASDDPSQRAALKALVTEMAVSSARAPEPWPHSISLLADGWTDVLYMRNWYGLAETELRLEEVTRAELRPSLQRFTLLPEEPYLYMVINLAAGPGQVPEAQLLLEIDLATAWAGEDLSAIYPDAATELLTKDGTLLYTNVPDETAASSRDYHIRRTVGSFGLVLDFTVPWDNISAPLVRARTVFVFICLLVLLFLLMLVTYVVRSQIRPLQHLQSAIESMSRRQLDVRISEATDYIETENLRLAFNSMAYEIMVLNKDTFRLAGSLKDAEYRRLEAQMQPHFLFNILELINIRAINAGEEGISRIVQNLAGLVRQSLETGDRTFAPLRNELNYVRYYLMLQQEMSAGRLSFSIEASDDTLLELQVPILVIEPLVENAVLHGLEPRDDDGWVKIRVWDEDDLLMITVQDNGVGFDPERKPARGGRRHGLSLDNIRERLQLLYGRPDCLQIHSDIGRGSTILLQLPPPEDALRLQDLHTNGQDDL